MARAKTETAYMLWTLGFLGICGLHRFYAGQIVLGLVYLCTFGLFGFGQLIDLVLVPGMVKTRNEQLRRKYLAEWGEDGLAMPVPIDRTLVTAQAVAQPKEDPMLVLLKAAHANGGKLSKAQVALHTGLSTERVEALIQTALQSGYADITNDPESGAVRYVFDL
ncbi:MULTISPECIES: TM2 domain-containing protein [Cyanophyceae]|uniref:TM2 domain-containing protein n=1 Tax=Cyanophyceae TaxID=3028117 RepID=UPI0016874BDB|nr:MULTISPECIES: TM2 domain-containing protein [Cyanophyceae]MBD1914612.1 TM2 domain-containing protein [Phormidium sp. FACHB-77]MBD2031009.1 TM2 domain-containing protein [Phormidium sp. FACHB-322]MBD2052616.1 TM2 domain-containing protein [Leptolyngbya sp. FACHB-60]